MRKEDFFYASQSPKNKLNIGDRVRFLNSVGGGTVTAFRSKDQVLVEDEDGFDVPVLISECVVIAPLVPPQGGKLENARDSALLQSTPERQVTSTPNLFTDNQSPSERSNLLPYVGGSERGSQGERLNLSLAFLLSDPQSFMQSAFEVYLINESNYYLYFNYMSCKNSSWTCRFHGLIEPDTKIFIEEFEKSEINEMEHLCIQMIAFKQGRTFSLKNTLSVELRLDTVKFYKLHCFTKNDFFDDNALIYPLVENDLPEKQMFVSAIDVQNAMCSHNKEERRTMQPAKKKPNPKDNVIEVDLHINQLLDSIVGMDNAKMLEHQLSKFHEVMKTNFGKKGQRIVFIHGKGEGVLRTAIEKELKTTYKGKCRFQDASFREYGFGATMVIIY